MKKINYKYVSIYALLIIYLIVSKFLFIPYFQKDYTEFINPLFWLIIFGICLFLKRDEESRIKSKTEKLQKLLIITILYYLIYFVTGLFVGYGYTIYSKSLLGIFKNTIAYVLPAIFQAYVICKLVFESYKNKFIIGFMLILFILLNLDLEAFISLSGNDLFEFLFSNVLVIVIRTIIIIYLAYMSSYEAILIYVIPYVIMTYLVPFIPKYDWFFTMLGQFILATVIYIVYRNIEKKTESYDNIKLYKNGNKFFEYLFLSIFFLIIFFVAGVFSYKPMTIMSNSMVPVFKRGDMVVIEKIKNYGLKNVKKGDIIVFKSDNHLVVHRLVKMQNKNGEIIYTTKGDNNSAEDPSINGEAIVGVVKFKIVYVGYPSVWLNEFLN